MKIRICPICESKVQGECPICVHIPQCTLCHHIADPDGFVTGGEGVYYEEILLCLNCWQQHKARFIAQRLHELARIVKEVKAIEEGYKKTVNTLLNSVKAAIPSSSEVSFAKRMSKKDREQLLEGQSEINRQYFTRIFKRADKEKRDK